MVSILRTHPAYIIQEVKVENTVQYIVAPKTSDWIRHLMLAELDGVDTLRRLNSGYKVNNHRKFVQKLRRTMAKTEQSLNHLTEFYSYSKGAQTHAYKKIQESLIGLRRDYEDRKENFSALYSLRSKGLRGNVKRAYLDQHLTLPYSVYFETSADAKSFLENGDTSYSEYKRALRNKNAKQMPSVSLFKLLHTAMKDDNWDEITMDSFRDLRNASASDKLEMKKFKKDVADVQSRTLAPLLNYNTLYRLIERSYIRVKTDLR